MITRKNKGFLSGSVAILCFSIISILGALVYQGGASPLTLLTGRAFIAGILLFLTLLVLKKNLFKIEKKDIFKLFLHSGILTVHLILYWQGLKVLGHIPTVLALFFTFPLWVFLMATVVLKEKISKTKILSLVLGIIGVLFTIQFLPALSFVGINLIGVGLMLLAALGWAIYILVGQELLKKYNLLVILFYNFLFCFIVFSLSQSLIVTVSHLTVSVMVYIALMGVVCTYLAYLCYLFAMKNIGASNMAVLQLAIPLISTILSFLILGQTVTLLQLFGIMLIISGVYLLYTTENYV